MRLPLTGDINSPLDLHLVDPNAVTANQLLKTPLTDELFRLVADPGTKQPCVFRN